MSWDSFYKNGWILYCPECKQYLRQSDPQNFSGRKQIIIDDVPCETCEEKRKEETQEVQEAQALMGRIGTMKKE